MNFLALLIHVVTNPWFILISSTVTAWLLIRSHNRAHIMFEASGFKRHKPGPVRLILGIVCILVAGWYGIIVFVVPAIGRVFNAIF